MFYLGLDGVYLFGQFRILHVFGLPLNQDVFAVCLVVQGIVNEELVVAWVQICRIDIHAVLGGILFHIMLALALFDEARLVNRLNVEYLILVAHLMEKAVPSLQLTEYSHVVNPGVLLSF